jgi:hypothetical protein
LKKKSLLSALLTTLIISGLILVVTVHFGTAQSGTNVTGIITSDTTWTQANSPYNLTGDVLVNNGVALTIEPGVFVNLSSYHMTVNGTLQAIGSSQNPIYINGDNSAGITFTPFAVDWDQSTGTGCIIENAIIGSYMVMYNSPEINNDTTYGRIVTVANATISNCYIYGGLDIVGGQGTVSDNTVTSLFGSMGYGIIIGSDAENATVSGNTITACSEGITVITENGLDVGNFTLLIEGNLIANNTYGIEIVAFSGAWLLTPLIQSNTITSNTYGIYFASFPSGKLTPATIVDNNIYDNSNYNVVSNVTNDVSATNNWWGTTDTQSINQTIYDFKNDPNWGNVSFVPFLDSPNIQAPTFVIFSFGTGGGIRPSGIIDDVGFVSGDIISVNYGGSQTFTITPSYGYYIADVFVNGTSVGAVSSYTVRNIQGATTISATFALNPTPTPTPAPTPMRTATPIPTTAPSPTPTLSATTVPATTDNDATVDLTISGNITSSQMSNVTIAANQSANTTTVSFTVTGESGTTGFSNVTIQKSAVPYGTTPTIYIDGQPAQNRGYTQDSNNYYVWYTTHFSTHEVSIVFTTTSPSPSPTAQPSLPQEAIYGIAAAIAIVAIVAVVLVLRKSKKGKS